MLIGYQELQPTGKNGPLDVTVRIVGYKDAALEDLGLDSQPTLVRKPAPASPEDHEEEEDDTLSYTIDLLLVDDASVDPAKHSLYNHPHNKVRFDFFLGFTIPLFIFCLLILILSSVYFSVIINSILTSNTRVVFLQDSSV